MTKEKYSPKQIEELLSNPKVRSCTSKYITYADGFKIKAIKLYKNWLYPKRIFKDFNFPNFVVNSELPRLSLKRWRRKIKDWWIELLITSKKWRKKKDQLVISKMSKDEYIKYLEAKIAYQEELYKRICGSAYP